MPRPDKSLSAELFHLLCDYYEMRCRMKTAKSLTAMISFFKNCPISASPLRPLRGNRRRAARYPIYLGSATRKQENSISGSLILHRKRGKLNLNFSERWKRHCPRHNSSANCLIIIVLIRDPGLASCRLNNVRILNSIIRMKILWRGIPRTTNCIIKGLYA